MATKKKAPKKANPQDDAAAIAKKMQEKSASGDCAFC